LVRLWLPSAALVYLALALYQLYPAWLDPLHAVVGDWRHPDMISNHWVYRWVAEQLLGGGSLIHNDRYYLPVGDAPWLAGNASDALPHTLVAALLPWPASITAWCLLMLVCNGLAGFALGRAVGASRAASLLGGAFLALAPYVTYEMSGMRLAQAPLYWLVFFLAAWLHLLREPSIKRGVGAGLLFGACAFSYWYYGLWAALLGGLLFLARPRPRALLGFVPTALLTTLPPLLVFLSHWTEIPGAVEDLFPHPLAVQNALWPMFPFWAGQGEQPPLVLPVALVVLAGLGWWRGAGAPKRTLTALLVAALLFYLLALGPWLLRLDGSPTGVPGLYWLLYAGSGMLRRFWWPYRHAVVVVVALVPLAALGFDQLARWLPRWSQVPLAILLTASLPLDLGLRGGQAAVYSSWFQPPQGYEELAELPGEALMEVPLAPELARSQQTLGYQWVHGKRLLNGHAMWVDRVRPPAWDEWVADNSFLAALQAYETGQGDGSFAFQAADIQALQDEGLRYLVLNGEYLPGKLIGLVPRYQELFEAAFGPPLEDHRRLLLVYDLDSYTGVERVELPAFAPEDAYLSTDGTSMPEAGPVNSLGWSPLDRSCPPSWPTSQRDREAELEDLSPMLRSKLKRLDAQEARRERPPQEEGEP